MARTIATEQEMGGADRAFRAGPDLALAAACYRQAADLGPRSEEQRRGGALLGGAGVALAPAEAETWLRRAAAGDLRTRSDAGLRPQLGEATHRLRLAAAHGAPEAKAALARLVLDGQGTEGDGRAVPAAARDCDPVAGFDHALCLGSATGRDRNAAATPASLARAAIPGIEKPTATLRRTASSGTTATARFHQSIRASASVGPGPVCSCGSGLALRHCCRPALWGRDRANSVVRAKERMTAAAAAAAAGDWAAATALCRAAVAAAPRQAQARVELARIERRRGATAVAGRLLRQAIATDANAIDAIADLALLCFDNGTTADAAAHAKDALRRAPNSPRAHAILGMALTEMQRPRLGEVHYRRAMALEQDRDPVLVANLAWCLKAQGRLTEARVLYAEAVSKGPEVFRTWLGWGLLEEADGRFVEAAAKLDRAAMIEPDAPDLAMARARLLARRGYGDAALAVLDRAGTNLAADPDALLERGRILDTMGRWDEAFACFAAGKRLAQAVTGNRYDVQAAIAAARRLKDTFSATGRTHLPPPSRPAGPVQPIFILGFPRSGTTLIEQMLSMHPVIRAGDELPFVGELTEEISRLLGSPLPYPEVMRELAMADHGLALDAMRDAYLRKAALAGVLDPGAAWFTDKMPLNETHLGLIGLIFPEAPLIHLIRHPLDVVLSVYSHHLTHGACCGYSITTIARHYVLVLDLVDFYRVQAPLRYLRVRYEDLVADFEGGVRAMLAHIGAAFDPDCVRIERNPRLAQTPSYAQVREAVHGRATFRYRNYRRHLGPALEILEPIIAQLGYPAE